MIGGYYIEQCRFIEQFCHHGKFYWIKLSYIKRLKPTQATEIHPIPKHLFIEEYSFSGSSQVMLVVKSLPANAGTKEKWVWPLGWEGPWRRARQPLQSFCLENPMDRGVWWATVQRVAKSWTRLKWLSTHTRIDPLRVTCRTRLLGPGHQWGGGLQPSFSEWDLAVSVMREDEPNL